MKLTFKQFLVESGFPFANITDDEKITIFGHTKDNLIKKDKDKEKLSKEENTKRKLNKYIQYAKVVNEE